jgi:ketosteroid isomerase-like protein
MTSNADVARNLYEAFERADPELLLGLLHPDFVGHVSEGMPGALGGTHVGPVAMLADVWAPIWRRFRARPVPERFLSCADGTVVVTGTYVGQSPDTTRALTAAFAHVLALREGLVCEMRQVTDTQRWAQAAAAADAEVVRRLFAAVEERDGQVVLDAYATDVVIREAPSLPYGGVYHGHDGALRHALAYTATWDNLQSAEDRRLQPQIRCCDDRVVVTWRQKATAGDGRHLDMPVVDLIGLRDGKVASLEMFQQDTAAVLDFLASHQGRRLAGRSSTPPF